MLHLLEVIQAAALPGVALRLGTGWAVDRDVFGVGKLSIWPHPLAVNFMYLVNRENKVFKLKM